MPAPTGPADSWNFHRDLGPATVWGYWANNQPVLENYFTGPPIPPEPDEVKSNKDTFKSYPETVTRIIIQEFTPPTRTIASIPGSGTEYPATYIHHCHILEHEDDDLMRPGRSSGPATSIRSRSMDPGP
ncbi:hypothetical protein ACIRU3_26465 [Streptomyces sp. NPDC101151]|uniref:hypothetical protein n=1 Tax=Streptomyces sp. NPDC101151 TaxID=3366115 RepID=UPI003802DC28